jgi:hypothetical protein
MVCLMVWMLVLGLSFHALPSFAATYSVASDFSPTSNPAGTWSYGWSAQLTSALDLYSFHVQNRDIDNWSDFDPLHPPTVSHNGTSGVVTHNPETITWQPGQFALHPGSGGEYSHARWTAPSAGTYYIYARFTGIDHTGTTTDVHILHNTSSLFTASVIGYGDTASFATTVSVSAGDFIDFAVGYGNGVYWDDTTALAATISTDPIPVGAGITVPHLTRLIGIHPNPINPQTRIRYELAREASVRLQVCDVHGAIVRTLVAGWRTSGLHTETWDGRDENGTSAASGIYFLRLEANGQIKTRQLVLLR